jgi:HK97 family phage prohead protease
MKIERKAAAAAEHKSIGLAELEIKFADGGDVKEMMFSGYGAVFGNVDSYGDVIQAGAFAETLAAAEKTGIYPAMLMQHGGWGMGADDMTPVGIWTSLSEDKKGLKAEGKLADTPRGREAYALLKMQPRPAITGLSIGYIPKEWVTRVKAEDPRRTLTKVDLLEISMVTFPANGKARVTGVKSAADLTERDFERLMQDAGLSRSEARVVINQGFKHLKAMQDAGSSDLSELAAAMKRNTELLLQHT